MRTAKSLLATFSLGLVLLFLFEKTGIGSVGNVYVLWALMTGCLISAGTLAYLKLTRSSTQQHSKVSFGACVLLLAVGAGLIIMLYIAYLFF